MSDGPLIYECRCGGVVTTDDGEIYDWGTDQPHKHIEQLPPAETPDTGAEPENRGHQLPETARNEAHPYGSTTGDGAVHRRVVRA